MTKIRTRRYFIVRVCALVFFWASGGYISALAELAQLIDTANAPIFGVDIHGNVNEWNQKDHILYKVPFGIPGDLVAGKWVRKDLEKVFTHRHKTIDTLLAN